MDRPVLVVGSGRCGSTLLQSVLNSNPEFLIWGEHNGFLRQVAEAYYGAAHPHFPVEGANETEIKIQWLRDPQRWTAWDNLCDRDGFRDRFRAFIRSFFADPAGKCTRWGFKEIRYAADANDQSLRLMADCFPEARFVILIRHPETTIFSMISHWVLAPAIAPLSAEELDEQILSRMAAWNEQYLQLGLFSEAHPPQCTCIRYEELGRAETYRHLADFLGTSSFDYQTRLERAQGASNKTGAQVELLRERMDLLRPRIAEITQPACIRFGYAGTRPESASLALSQA